MRTPARLAALLLPLILLSAAHAKDERLVLLGVSYGKNLVAICEMDGTVLWKHDTAGPKRGHTGHHDIHLLDSGNVLFHDTWTRTQEITLGKKVVWEYESARENGNQGKRVDVHAFKRFPDGSTMIAESGVGRFLHVDKDGKKIREVPMGEGGRRNTRLVRVLDNGHYLSCAESPGVVTEYNQSGKVVWEYKVGSRVYGAIRLKNGNTLIASGNGKSILEVNPEKEIVWEIKGKVPDTEIGLGWMTCLQELSNGNYVIGNCHAGDKNPQIFEITRDKKVTWQFDEWDLVGNGLACWQILEGEEARMVRGKLKELK